MTVEYDTRRDSIIVHRRIRIPSRRVSGNCCFPCDFSGSFRGFFSPSETHNKEAGERFDEILIEFYTRTRPTIF